MDDLAQLEYWSVVNRVCKELENHVGLNDKVLGNSNFVYSCYVIL